MSHLCYRKFGRNVPRRHTRHLISCFMIQIDELVFSYRGRCVYDGMSLELKDGAVYGLLGRNGAGKTTLMRLIAGLLRCGNGRIEVDGRVPSDRKPEFLDNVYFVPESFNAPDMTVSRYAGCYGMFYSRYDGDAMADYLKAFEVDPDAVFSTLSTGQKKKAMIAFALSLNTRLLLLDEPGNGLDIPSKLCLRRLLAECSRPDRTVVLSTHQVREIDEIVDHLVVIDSGRLLLEGSLDDIAGCISFKVADSTMPDALFSERTAAGTVSIIPNATDNRGTGRDKIDMEILFDACISGGKRMTDYLRTHVGHSGK